MTTLLHGGKILTEKVGLIRGDLMIRDGKIAAIGENLPSEGEILDITGLTVAPGLIDTHNHGCMGTEFASEDEHFDKGLQYLAESGITTVVPTLRCLPHRRMLLAIENVKREMDRGPRGAKIGGINMEGPFLSPNRIGSMRPENLAKPEKKALLEYLAACEGTLRSITMAPEVEGVLELVDEVLFAGVNPSIGHTNATFEEARAMADAGATLVTHLFNAMSGFTHRAPGVVGEALTDDRLTCELICDYVHNTPAAVDLAIRSKGIDKIVMISDTGRMSGLGDGEYIIEGHKRIVKDHLCMTPEGVIAGSVCNLFYDFKNLLNHGYSLSEVSRMASLNPARVIGVDHLTGSIAVGKAADLILLDEECDLKGVFVDGQRV
ncbi:MAG: N-acetylglucosamine-6-phosphate deacetylase [Ruminococcaceae bacterium]|nr:N-acetylglucosamine-6-phosphate deacetylase [Oscillospiraceae bacterium]